jgi:hypothetical protein
VATQLNDMSLGGSGFAAGYTPIRFAPLVSLTGPITAPAPPAAPEAPMARPPMLPIDQGGGGGYEGMGPAFTGEPIGTRMSTPAGRQAELANLANAAGFLASPAMMMAAYAMTGQSPAQMFGVGNQREALGLQQSDVMPQGIVPPGGVSRLFGGLRDYLFGPPQQSVSLAEAQGGPSQQTLGMAAQSATNIADMYGLSPEQAAQVGQTAAGLVAQGMNITEAITLATNYGAYSARPDMAGSPFGQPAMQGAAPQGMPGFGQLTPDFLTEYGAPIAQAPAETFGIGGGGQVGVSPDFVGQSLAADNYGVMGFSGGGQVGSYDFSGDFGGFGEASGATGGWV